MMVLLALWLMPVMAPAQYDLLKHANLEQQAKAWQKKQEAEQKGWWAKLWDYHWQLFTRDGTPDPSGNSVSSTSISSLMHSDIGYRLYVVRIALFAALAGIGTSMRRGSKEPALLGIAKLGIVVTLIMGLKTTKTVPATPALAREWMLENPFETLGKNPVRSPLSSGTLSSRIVPLGSSQPLIAPSLLSQPSAHPIPNLESLVPFLSPETRKLLEKPGVREAWRALEKRSPGFLTSPLGSGAPPFSWKPTPTPDPLKFFLKGDPGKPPREIPKLLFPQPTPLPKSQEPPAPPVPEEEKLANQLLALRARLKSDNK